MVCGDASRDGSSGRASLESTANARRMSGPNPACLSRGEDAGAARPERFPVLFITARGTSKCIWLTVSKWPSSGKKRNKIITINSPRKIRNKRWTSFQSSFGWIKIDYLIYYLIGIIRSAVVGWSMIGNGLDWKWIGLEMLHLMKL